MDTSHYIPNALNDNSPYGNLPGISLHKPQQSSSLTQHTLPPLQAPQHAMQNLYRGSAPHTSRTLLFESANGTEPPQMQAQQQQQQQRQNQMIPMSQRRLQHLGGMQSPYHAMTPAKDADGKCPHCIKTYLHAKHLKRHLLRRKYPDFPRENRN